jgi:hypothetical protein
MRSIRAIALTVAATLTAGCSKATPAMDAQQIEQQYGVSGAYPETIATPDGPMKGLLVPITLANGRAAHLFIPEWQARDQQPVYMRDAQGLHPVLISETANRESLARSPQIEPSASVLRRVPRRPWEKQALIIGGGASGGAAIGALAGGKKGAGVGAAAGGIGALIYDLTIRGTR